MKCTAKHRWAQISPQKAREVAQLIRKQPVNGALDTLRFTPKRAASVISKVLHSALANAQEQDPKLDEDNFLVAEARVDAGPVLKRHRYAAQGRVRRIRHRTCHITVTISDE